MLTLKVDGMTCGHCVQSVTKVLSSIPKVEKVSRVDLAAGVAVVEGEPDAQAVIAALAKAGFPARVNP